MQKDHLLALDQGTSSSRAIVFHRNGHIVAQAQRELTQHFPQPGWVEHDPNEIWSSQRAVAEEALQRAGLRAAGIAAIGITNQRETTLLWHRTTGRPVHRAIVWQDRRTEPLCAQLREHGLSDAVRERTGLVIDPYFSGTKLRWLLDHVNGAHIAAARGELAFGTVDTWLLWQLTEGRVHATDVSNASRTMLFDIRHGLWDHELLAALHVPDSLLPQVAPSSHLFGTTRLLGEEIPVAGIAGDQQAALFGQAGFGPGVVKNTYGTGCFMLMPTGPHFHASRHGLVTTATAQVGEARGYALEGSVFVGGAVVQWLRDGLHAISASTEVESLAASVPDAGGVVVVPAFTGLGAPYWRPEARGSITGLSRGSTVAHIARAALESIAFQSAALLQAMTADAQAAQASQVPLPQELRVDGGACVNDLLMQFQAELLGIPVLRPAVTETTALGAAFLAGLAVGLYPGGTEELTRLWRAERRFEPSWPRERASEAMARWEHAVRQTLAS
jgi:glycerol kinase